MLFRATTEIADVFEKEDLKFDISDMDDSSLVEARFNTKKAGSLRILFISHDDDSDVAIRAFKVVTGVPDEKRAALLEAVNSCNDQYRFAKFILDEDGDINMEYDLPVETNDVGEIALEIAIRFVQIADEAYPTMMKALWG
ncbi:MAG: YbjN domain-containing protein [Ruminococcaceae bacterium]|jgi:hypothetical protein|nr:YbjN domain-containing protein [Oscillospiraceae bacterium]